MKIEDILTIPAGPELDQLVHSVIYGNAPVKKIPPYSTKDATGMVLMDRLPLFVGKADAKAARFNPMRPYVAGTLRWNADLQTDVVVQYVTSATRMGALCKMALLHTLQPEPVLKSDQSARPRTNQPRVGSQPRQPIVAQIMPKRPEKFVGPEVQKNDGGFAQ